MVEDRSDCRGSFADSTRHPLHGPRANISHREQTRMAGLEGERVPTEHPPPTVEIGGGQARGQ